jgi:hypothetical protein
MALEPAPARRDRRSPAHHDGRPRRRSRPLDDRTSELVHVIEFLWPAGESSVQPVLWVQRELLH